MTVPECLTRSWLNFFMYCLTTAKLYSPEKHITDQLKNVMWELKVLDCMLESQQHGPGGPVEK
jgi:hypothetical protein